MNRKILILFIVAVVLVAGCRKKKEEPIKEPEEIKKAEIKYQEKGDILYSVCYKDNEYMDDLCIDRDQDFVTNMIDYIDLRMMYSFNISEEIEYIYSYRITGIIGIRDKKTNSLLYDGKEEFVIREGATLDKTKEFIIDESMRIDYKKYTDILEDFKKELGVTLSGALKITLHIELDWEHEKLSEPVIIVNDIELVISLSEQTFNFRNYENFRNSETITLE